MVDVANGQNLAGGLIAAVGGSIVSGNVLENVGNTAPTERPQSLTEEPPKSDLPDEKQAMENSHAPLEQDKHPPLSKTAIRERPPYPPGTAIIPLVIFLSIVPMALYICVMHWAI